tara:strand:+ start:98 stop:391 length:294 start_codon:yes stop_codon:yes gene_type:complete
VNVRSVYIARLESHLGILMLHQFVKQFCFIERRLLCRRSQPRITRGIQRAFQLLYITCILLIVRYLWQINAAIPVIHNTRRIGSALVDAEATRGQSY